ncbi:MAG: hypothetical protein ABJN35_06015 [Erythrobacter sp.]
MTKRNFTRRFLEASALLAFAVGHPVLAQDNEGSDDGDDDTVENVLLLSALGLSAPDGKTELEDGAGDLESHMILAPMLDDFGADLADALTGGNTLTNGDRIILLVGEDNFSLTKLTVVESWLAIIEARLRTEAPQCPASGFDDPFADMGDGAAGDGRRIDTSPIALAQTVADLLQSETKISSVDVDPSEQLLINAVSAAALSWSGPKPAAGVAPTYSASWVVPGDVIYVGATSIMDRYLKAVSEVGALANLECAKANDSPVKAFVASITEALETLSKPGSDGAPSLLEEAILLQPLQPANSESLMVLHIDIEQAGGTIEQRSNIFTTIGLSSGIRISGGMVGSYRLTNGTNGAVLKSGTFYCRGPIRSFGDSHRPRQDDDGDCSVN